MFFFGEISTDKKILQRIVGQAFSTGHAIEMTRGGFSAHYNILVKDLSSEEVGKFLRKAYLERDPRKRALRRIWENGFTTVVTRP